MSDKRKPGPDYSGAGPVAYDPTEVGPTSPIEQLLADEEARLFAIPGVVSVGIGIGGPRGQVIEVGVTDAGVAARLPRDIGGVPVTAVVTGPIYAQRTP